MNYSLPETTATATNDTDVIFDSENQATEADKLTSTSKSTNFNSTALLEDSQKSFVTPTASITTASRLNPFKSGSSKTPLQDSSKSIINEIEEKLNKQSASKEKDSWKPTPTRKLVKSKLSTTPTGSMGSFFGNKK